MPLLHRAHGHLLRLFWRVIAPRHPRGWLDIHPVMDENGERAWLHCHGMERWSLPNLEIMDVPGDLLGPAHGILMAITGYMKLEQPVGPDEDIGGFFHSSHQTAAHAATLRRSPYSDEDHGGFLRVVDHRARADAGFPFRLFAAHLIALADDTKDRSYGERLLRRATEIYPGSLEDASTSLEASTENPNNYFGWQGLGFRLVEQRRYDQGIAALREAAARWPAGAERDAQAVREAIAAGGLPPPEQDAVSAFWSTLDARAVRAELAGGAATLRSASS